jgi:hypothetical protein
LQHKIIRERFQLIIWWSLAVAVAEFIRAVAVVQAEFDVLLALLAAAEACHRL